jgi:hypothetical protein
MNTCADYPHIRRVCSKYGGEERCITIFVGIPEGKNHLGDPGSDGRIILK